jgi:N-sulfoglucosamine sulfohydrolase
LPDLPNILYVHSHDTGRWVRPYGYATRTPNIQRLAEEGVIFRKAFCAAPTCSGSRACLLTGQYAHSNGMVGLAHRGFSLKNYRHHIVHTLHELGYWSALIGEQHISKKPDVIGYDEVYKIPTNHTLLPEEGQLRHTSPQPPRHPRDAPGHGGLPGERPLARPRRRRRP